MVLRATLDKKQEKERIREALIIAALRLGAEQGFPSLGLRAVAREAQIAPTSFYRHFEDMEALGLGIVQDKVEPFLREWAAALPDNGESPTRLVAALADAVDRQPALTRFIVAERVGCSAALRAALHRALTVLTEHLLSDLKASQRSPEHTDAAQLTTVVVVESAAQLLDATESRDNLKARVLTRLTTILASMQAVRQRHA